MLLKCPGLGQPPFTLLSRAVPSACNPVPPAVPLAGYLCGGAELTETCADLILTVLLPLQPEVAPCLADGSKVDACEMLAALARWAAAAGGGAMPCRRQQGGRMRDAGRAGQVGGRVPGTCAMVDDPPFDAGGSTSVTAVCNDPSDHPGVLPHCNHRPRSPVATARVPRAASGPSRLPSCSTACSARWESSGTGWS